MKETIRRMDCLGMSEGTSAVSLVKKPGKEGELGGGDGFVSGISSRLMAI